MAFGLTRLVFCCIGELPLVIRVSPMHLMSACHDQRDKSENFAEFPFLLPPDSQISWIPTMSPPNARNQPAVAVRLAAPKYAHKQAEALLRQLKTASTAVTSTANQSLSSAKQLDLIGSLFARVSAVYAASPTEAFPIVSKILSHVGSVELPSLREKIGEVDVGRREALQSKQEAWVSLIEKILKSLKASCCSPFLPIALVLTTRTVLCSDDRSVGEASAWKRMLRGSR